LVIEQISVEKQLISNSIVFITIIILVITASGFFGHQFYLLNMNLLSLLELQIGTSVAGVTSVHT